MEKQSLPSYKVKYKRFVFSAQIRGRLRMFKWMKSPAMALEC